MTTRASGGRLPLVCDVPHAGRRYPGHDQRSIDTLQLTEDRFADVFYAPLRDVALDWHEAEVARTIVDLNRPRDGRAFRRTVLQGTPINRRLTEAETAHRLTQWYDPYVRGLEDSLERALQSHGWVTHLNLHSFPTMDWHTPGRPPMPFDIEIGDRGGATSSRGLGVALTQALSEAGYHVARNDTFAGGELVQRVNARFGDAVESVQVEVGRNLYLDRDLDLSPPKLREHRTRILATIEGTVRELTRTSPETVGRWTSTFA